MSRKSRPLMAAAGAASAAIALAMAPAPAQAATPDLISCYAAGCDPYLAAQTTCVDDAEVIYAVNIYDGSTVVGNIELKYSPSCRTTWARVISDLAYGSYAQIASNGNSNLWSSCSGSNAAGTGCNTYMIDDLAPLTSWAVGGLYDSNGNNYDATTASF
jgi:Protein of unknown function (DUF2690)